MNACLSAAVEWMITNLYISDQLPFPSDTKWQMTHNLHTNSYSLQHYNLHWAKKNHMDIIVIVQYLKHSSNCQVVCYVLYLLWSEKE